MNNTFNNIKGISLVMVCCLLALFTSCKEEEIVLTPTADLTTLLAEAEDLIANSEEGTQAGDIKPGSIDELQSVVDWVYWTIENGDDAGDLDDAAVKLEFHIEKFKTSLVTLAIPYITQEESGTWIAFSDNARDLIAGDFSVEGSFYVVDLTPKDYSNNMFTCVSADGGDRGFELRYFADGSIHINLGNGSSWNQVASDPGAIKAGVWQHIAYTSTAGTAILYIDGVKVLENNNVYELATDNPFIIGNVAPWGANRIMNGLVTDVRFWSGVRTADEINDNKDALITGEEEGLEAFFPFDADLGTIITDITGNYTATFTGSIEWIEGGTPPVIILDYTAFDATVAEMVSFQATVVEGTNTGDHPVGTIAYLQDLIDGAAISRVELTTQDGLDEEQASLQTKLETTQDFTVANAQGVYIDYNNSDAVGFRITPNYTPQGNYTVEFDVFVTSLEGYGSGEFFNNGEYGIWVTGYGDESRDEILASGGLWNFTSSPSGWQGPKADPLTMKEGEWQHVAIVHNNTDSTTIMYVDGQEEGIQEHIAAPNVSGWSEMWLGNGWGKMHGSIKDFRLWDVARTAAELNTEIVGTETGLKVYFPLDVVAGVEFSDVTGNFQGEMRGIEWNVE